VTGPTNVAQVELNLLFNMDPVCPIQVLSNELLISILENLHLPEYGVQNQPDLASCALVNRHWHTLASTVQWQSIHLDTGWKIYHKPTSKRTKSSEQTSRFIDNSRRSSMWGNDLLETRFTNKFGVRPDKLNLLKSCTVRRVLSSRSSPFDDCRSITIFIGSIENISDVVSTLLLCKNLCQVDIAVDVKRPTTKLRVAWNLVARYLSNLPLSTLRIKFSYGSSSVGVPDSFTGIPEELGAKITDLSVRHLTVNIGNIIQQLAYPHLRSFTYVLGEVQTDIPPKYFSPAENATFWKALEALPLEELGFSVPYTRLTWEGGQATFPPTLKRVVVKYDEGLAFNPMPILQQLGDLRTLVIRKKNLWRNEENFFSVDYDTWEEIVPIPYATIACHKLQTLHLYGNLSTSILHTIFPQCPLIDDVVFPRDTSQEDMVMVMEHCPSIKRVAFDASTIGTEGLRDLVKLQSLQIISVVVYQFEDLLYQQVAVYWARECPSLSRVILSADRPIDSTIEMATGFFLNLGQTYEMEEGSIKWFVSFVREDKLNGYLYLDMEAMRSDDEGCLNIVRVNRTRRLSFRRNAGNPINW
jgi:hypothetical protein